MKKDKKLDVVFILDKSGSMGGSEEHTISSYNEYLEKNKNNKFKTNITTCLFSDQFSYLYKSTDIKNTKNLTEKEYFVGGCTALYDAVGSTINYIDSIDTDKVMFVIITDGYENASREFNNKKVKKMIKNHNNWEFIFIGADIDSYAVGDSIGIRKDRIASYKKDRKGTSMLFEAVGSVSKSMMSDESIGNWKEKLDEYIDSVK